VKEKKKEYVVFKSVRLPLYKHMDHRGDGRASWRFAYPDDNAKGGWRYGTRTTREAAKKAAHDKAVEIAKGVIDLANLSPSDARLCRAFLDMNPSWDELDHLRDRRQLSGLSISAAISAFKEFKLSEKGEITKHLTSSFNDLGRLSAHVGPETPLGAVSSAQITAYLANLDVGEKRRKNHRGAAVMLWRWAAKQDMIKTNGGFTEAEKTPSPKVTRGPIRFLSTEEMAFLLENVSPDYAPWLVLCGFSGLRSSEVRGWNKPPLTGAMVKLSQGVVDVPAESSKNRKRKLIPILPVLADWLQHLDLGDGPLIPDPAYKSETSRLGALMDEEFGRDEGWPDNCLRHSYCSYRVAATKNVPAVALEMDNSEKIIKEHYLEATTEAQAKAYFALSPRT
tara:strand:+ start:43 stop:1224 length:1182 start_codon:yes stop_codon:yes gene_type:complete